MRIKAWVTACQELAELPLSPLLTRSLSLPLPPPIPLLLALPTCGDSAELSYLSNVETLASRLSHMEAFGPS